MSGIELSNRQLALRTNSTIKTWKRKEQSDKKSTQFLEVNLSGKRNVHKHLSYVNFQLGAILLIAISSSNLGLYSQEII